MVCVISFLTPQMCVGLLIGLYSALVYAVSGFLTSRENHPIFSLTEKTAFATGPYIIVSASLYLFISVPMSSSAVFPKGGYSKYRDNDLYLFRVWRSFEAFILNSMQGGENLSRMIMVREENVR